MFYTQYSEKRPLRKIVKFGPSKTQQCFKAECDINEIVRRPNMGINPFCKSDLNANFGDFSDLKDFHTAQNIICKATQSFEQLPATVRDRFHGRIDEFVSFINEGEKNIEEGVKLGIYEKSALDKLSSIKTGENSTAQTVSPSVESTLAQPSAQQ